MVKKSKQRKEELKEELSELKEELETLLDLNYKLGENDGKPLTIKKDKTSEPISKAIIKARFEHAMTRLFHTEDIVFPKKKTGAPTTKRNLSTNNSIAKVSEAFMNFFSDKKFDLGTIELDGETINLKDYLRTLKVGYMTDRLVNCIIQRYTSGFSTKSTYNKEHPDQLNGSVIGADDLMFRHLGDVFEQLRKETFEELEKNGHKEGELKKKTQKETYQNQWHVFDPSNFVRIDGLGKIKKYARTKDEDVPLLSEEAEKKYLEKVMELLEQRPNDLSIYDLAAAELDDEFEEAARIRAAIDHDTKIFYLIKMGEKKSKGEKKEKAKKNGKKANKDKKDQDEGKEDSSEEKPKKNGKKADKKEKDEDQNQNQNQNQEDASEEKPKKARRFKAVKE